MKKLTIIQKDLLLHGLSLLEDIIIKEVNNQLPTKEDRIKDIEKLKFKIKKSVTKFT